MLYNLDERGKRNWVSKLRFKLCELGFAYVWFNQGVEDINGFIRVLRTRLIDCRWQECSSHIQESDGFSLYRQFSLLGKIPVYLSMVMDRHLKHIITKFRFGMSELFVHNLRYRQHCVTDLLCPLCKGSVDNEVHFVLCCPMLNDLRTQLIPQKYVSCPSMFRLCIPMSSTNERINKRIAMYLYKAFKIRNTICT